MTSTTTDRRSGVNSGMAIKVPCRAATTAAITLSGEQTIDGVACVTGDRVLVKNQSSGIDNGIYEVDTGAWSRTLDFDGENDVVTGTMVTVVSGSVNSATSWRVTTTGAITPGSTSLAFATAYYSGLASLSFMQSGTGAVTRSAESKMRDVVSVMDFGATGDGVTDDYATFVAALAAHSGAKIHIPSGDYRIELPAATALAIGAGTVLEGDGMANTTITLVVPSTTYISCINPSGNGIAFRNLKMVLDVPAGGSAAMFVGDVSDVVFENCDLDGAVTNSGASISHDAYIINFSSSGTQADYTVRGCDVHRFTFPLLKANSATSAQSRLSFEHCDFYGNYYEDLSFNSPNGSMDDVQIYMCRFRDGAGAGASLSQLYIAFASVTNFRVGGCNFSGAIGVGGAAVHLEENCVGGSITGNTMNVQGYGVSMNGNDRVSGGAITQPSHITVVGNTIRKYGTQKEASSFGIACVHNPDLDPAAKNIIVANNDITGYATGIYSVLTLDDSSLIRGNHIENCTVGMDFKDGSCTVSGNTTANCTTGIKGSASSSTVDSAVIDDHTFISCTTNVDATELPITLLNPRFIFAEFDHAGGSTSVYKLCTPMGSNDRLHGFLEINVDSDNSTSYSRQRDEVTWDGTTFTKTDKITIEPGAINTNAANNSSSLAVQVFASAARTGVRVQAKLNGMAVVAV